MRVGGWALALDIGGTKLAAGLVRPDGCVAVQEAVATRRDEPGDVIFADLVALADRVLAAGAVRPCDLVGIGVGCGGPMLYPEGRVSPLNLPAWRDFPLRAALQGRDERPGLGGKGPKAPAPGENWDGARRGGRGLPGMGGSTRAGGRI